MPKVLVVDDDHGVRKLLDAALRREGLEVDTAAGGAEALRLCAAYEYAVILLDLMMPGVNGFDFLDAFAKATPRARSVIFVITAFDDRMVSRLTARHVHAIVRKPFDVQQLVTTVREVAQLWLAEAQRDASISAPLAVRPPALPC